MPKGKVFLVGAGPGDPGLLTLAAAEILKYADAVLYDGLVNPEILDLANPRAERVFVGKKTFHPYKHANVKKLSQSEINRLITKHAKMGKLVVRLKGGDPFVFGRGGEEAEWLKQNNIEFKVIPGITSGIAAPAYAGIPLTHRNMSSSAAFITGSEDEKKITSRIAFDALAKSVQTLVFYMGVERSKQICKELITEELSKNTPACMIQWGTLPHQRVIEGNLGNIYQKAKQARLESPSILIVGEVCRLRKKLFWFEKKPLKGKTVLVTRAQETAGKLKLLLTLAGARVIEFPTFRILPPDSYLPLDNQLKHIKDFQWIIFTSMNGVTSFFDRVEALNIQLQSFRRSRFCAIGEKTAQAIRERGFHVNRMPSTFTSNALAASFEKGELKRKNVLLARADIAPDTLQKKLSRMGAIVTSVVAYRTVPEASSYSKINRLIKNTRVHWITFTSASTVDNFLKLAGNRRSLFKRSRVACIGPVTAKRAISLGFPVDTVAKIQTIEELVRAIIQFEQS